MLPWQKSELSLEIDFGSHAYAHTPTHTYLHDRRYEDPCNTLTLWGPNDWSYNSMKVQR